MVGTGVIGRRMKMDAFIPAIPEISQVLGDTEADGHRAAVAITTTGASCSHQLSRSSYYMHALKLCGNLKKRHSKHALMQHD